MSSSLLRTWLALLCAIMLARVVIGDSAVCSSSTNSFVFLNNDGATVFQSPADDDSALIVRSDDGRVVIQADGLVVSNDTEVHGDVQVHGKLFVQDPHSVTMLDIVKLLRDLANSLASLSTRVDALEIKLQAHEGAINSLNSKTATLESLHASLSSMVNSLNSRLSSIEHKIQSVSHDCYKTDFGAVNGCTSSGPKTSQYPPCQAGYTFMGVAEVRQVLIDCGNWSANVNLQFKSLCCRNNKPL